MKYALIIPDGCADEPQAVLGDRTPLQAANIHHMNRVAQFGGVGATDNTPLELPSGSDVATMSLLGYDPIAWHTGRAPIEAAAQGITLGPYDWAIRCNLVTIRDGIMVSFTAEQISNDAGQRLIEALQQQLEGERWEFHSGVSYRNLLIYRGDAETPAPFGPTTRTVPPHDLTDGPVVQALPQGPGGAILQNLMDRSIDIFSHHDLGESAATQIWLWGQGQAPSLVPFETRFGIKGGMITAVDLLRGLARLLGWRVIDVAGATGYLDTDYAAKGAAAVKALDEVDFVVVHVEATDEASHEGNAAAKVQALEQIDIHIVGPILEKLQSSGDYRILISPDHPTFLRTKTHSHGFVPFALCGTGISIQGSRSYDEPVAAKSAWTFPRGYELMEQFLKRETW